jgi:CheY-like chemotaxis protein
VKVLLVDDNEEKSRAIVAMIKQTLGDGRLHSVAVATSLANAVRVLSLVAFDVIVLDLMLPYIEGGVVDNRAGLELLRQLRAEPGPNRSTMVIGISAFPDEIAASRDSFDALGVFITRYDDEGSWSRVLLRALEEAKGRTASQIDLDFLVFCALEEERGGFIRTNFEKISEAVVSGLNVHYVRLPNLELFGGIIRLSQTGLVAATFEVTAALNTFHTKVLCMSGICAGFATEAHAGQLVIASPAWEYQAGKWSENRFEIAPMQVPLRPATRSVIDQTINRDGFVRNVESGIDPAVTRPSRQHNPILAPFATGSAVIADVHRLEHIKQQHRKVAALDMETFGLYFAAHESTSNIRHFFSIKCVVDFADCDKGDDLHPYGCAVSARATEELIREFLVVN